MIERRLEVTVSRDRPPRGHEDPERYPDNPVDRAAGSP